MEISDRPIEGPGLGGVVITAKNILLILVLGSVWGVAELFGRDLLTFPGLGEASTWLAVWALLVLSVGRGLWNKIGSSALIGLVAAAFKFAGPNVFICQLLGIAAIGLFFDLFASVLLSRGRNQWWRHALVGALTVYGARTFFVVYSVYVSRWDRWVEGGAEMAFEHIAVGGSVAAVAALLVAPLGFRLGEKAAAILSDDPAGKALPAENR